MKALEKFMPHEIKGLKALKGGGGATLLDGNPDSIHTDSGGMYMVDSNGNLLGCSTDGGHTFSMEQC